MLNLIVNPKSLKRKGFRLLSAIEKRLCERGTEYKIYRSRKAGDLRETVKKLTEAGEEFIVAFGGDGTLNEVVSGIADPAACRLGLIPAGTGNDFAAAAKIPFGLKALDLILDGKAKPTDYIEIDGGLRSINIAGMGIDVDILLNCEKKKHGGRKSKYFRGFLSSLFHYKGVHLKVSADGGEVKEYNSLIACICNGHTFGGGIPMCPSAKIDDGMLELLVCDCPPRGKMLFQLIKFLRGKILSLPLCHHVRCKSAQITAEGESYAQLDGELVKTDTLTAHIVSGKLKMFRG